MFRRILTVKSQRGHLRIVGEAVWLQEARRLRSQALEETSQGGSPFEIPLQEGLHPS